MKTKQNYSVEFRAEAVKLVLEQELSQGEAAAATLLPYPINFYLIKAIIRTPTKVKYFKQAKAY